MYCTFVYKVYIPVVLQLIFLKVILIEFLSKTTSLTLTSVRFCLQESPILLDCFTVMLDTLKYDASLYPLTFGMQDF